MLAIADAWGSAQSKLMRETRFAARVCLVLAAGKYAEYARERWSLTGIWFEV